MQTVLQTHQQPTSGEQASVLPLHVALLTNFMPPHSLAVFQALARRVRKLTILLSTPMEENRNWRPEWGDLDVRIQKTTTIRRPRRHPGPFSDTLYVHIPWDTRRQLKSLKPDVVVSAEFGLRSLFSTLYCGGRRGTPLVLWANMSEHTELGRGWLRHQLRKWLVRRAAALAINGISGRRYLENELGVPPEKVFHVPYAAVPNLFERIALQRPAANAHRLIFAGRLVDLKGLLPFVEALSRWATAHPDHTVEFDIAGEGPERATLAGLDLPANLRLHLLGELTYQQLADRFAGAGIFAFPSLSDEWGLVINEALAAGLPVLGSQFSQAVYELCQEGETGWKFRTTEPAELDAAIERALSTTTQRLDEMRAQARACVQLRTPEFSAEQFMQAIAAVHANRLGNSI